MFLLIGFWVVLLLGALWMPQQAVPWVSGMSLPLVGAGFFLGPRWAFGIGFLSALVCVGLAVEGQIAVGWIAGPLTLFCLLPFLLWRKAGQLQETAKGSQERLQSLGERLRHIQEELKDRQITLRSEEEAISGISDLYGLSKQFLATLEEDQALRITEEALIKALPRVGEQVRSDVLWKIRSQVEQGEVSIESLVSSLAAAGGSRTTVSGPVAAVEGDRTRRSGAMPTGNGGMEESWERGGIVIGQLALGLKRVSLYRQVQESAIHDGLTGLLVRRYFRERLEEEVARASRRGTHLAFLMVDLDHFKQVNDTYGHLVGDLVLREVARRVQASVREVDWVGRYGGEEFGVVLPEAGRALGIQIADRIREVVGRTPIPAYDEKVQITVSIGVALCPEDASSADLLVEQADEAMYEAKARGRNRTVPKGRGKTAE